MPSVKFAIFETQFAKVSSLEIFSHENIFSQGITNLTDGKVSYAQKHRKRYHFRQSISIRYSAIMFRNRGYVII